MLYIDGADTDLSFGCFAQLSRGSTDGSPVEKNQLKPPRESGLRVAL